jgi:penicillin amidase
VGPARSATGSPLLANDPHLALTAPGPWYLAHLEAPGLAVIGATLPAVPFVVLGRNRDVAWGFTNTGSDVQDLFLEAPDPADPGRYLTPDGPAPFATRTEEILVRGAAAERLVVRETRHGPVISDVSGAAAQAAPGGRVMALAWTGLDRPTAPPRPASTWRSRRTGTASARRSARSRRRSRTSPTPTAPGAWAC